MFEDSLHPIFTRIADRWDRLEALIKRSENLVGDAIGPTIFELRYGGRKLVDAISLGCSASPDQEAIVKIISEVEECCDRGHHDAVDAIIFFLRRSVEHNEETFGPDLLLQHWPNYTTTKAKLDELGEIVVSSRQFRGQRTDVYNHLEDDEIPAIIERIRELQQSETALIALAEKRQQEDNATGETLKDTKSTLKVTRWLLGFAVVTVLIAVGAMVVAHKDASHDASGNSQPQEQQNR